LVKAVCGIFERQVSAAKRNQFGLRPADYQMILKKQLTDKQVKVRVIDRWRVVHPDDGTAHVKGGTLTIPEHVAKERVTKQSTCRCPASPETTQAQRQQLKVLRENALAKEGLSRRLVRIIVC
jgi:hypothetical protein